MWKPVVIVAFIMGITTTLYAIQPSTQRYIDGTEVSTGRVTLCDTLSHSLRVSRSPRLRTVLSFRIHEECGYKFVQSLSWYLRNNEPIPVIYKHVFKTKKERLFYDNLIGNK